MGNLIREVVRPIANIFTGADETQRAGEQAAAQQRQAAREAAPMAVFRPVGMTTAFGTSQFTQEIDPTTGIPYITSAGYTPSSQLQGLQQGLLGNLGSALGFAQQQGQAYAPLGSAANQLFGLGSQYLATSPEAAAQDYINKQQALLESSRSTQLAGIRNRLFQTGRGGLGVQTGTGGAPASPEMQAYYNALAQQDLQLAAQADEAARQRIMFGTGLFGTGGSLLGAQTQGQTAAFSPLQTILGLSTQAEQLSQMPFQLSLQLGQAAQPGSGQAAGLFSGGMQQAAQTQYGASAAANAANAGFWGGLLQGGANIYAQSRRGTGSIA